LLAAYFVAYTVAYCTSMERPYDSSLYVEYLYLGWTFRGLEQAFFVWLFSLLLFVPIALFFVFLQGRLLVLAKAARSDRAIRQKRFTASTHKPE